jgi:LysM repeat protein
MCFSEECMQTAAADSDGSSKRGSATAARHAYHGHIFSLPTRGGSVPQIQLVAALVAVAIPLSVYAGLLTVPEPAIPTIPEVTSTTHATSVKLLSAHLTADPKAARGGGDIIVSEGALVPGGVVGDDLVDSSNFSTGEISLYVVREGDTLSQIAEMFSVNSNTILWANDITNPQAIQPGDTLVILPITGVRHVVKEGDTLAAIAKKYEGDLYEIVAYNQLASASDIAVGDTVVIPGGNMQQAAPARVAASPTRVTGSAAIATSFMHPAPGAIRTQGIHGYNAVDLAAGYGSPVRAAAAGEVIVSKSSGWNGGYGNYIVVRHGNGTQTLYAHLSRNNVGVGAFVAAGEVIGAMGNTGRSTGTHLHFEVRGATNPF